MTKAKEHPAIFTADGKPVEVGMTVYGFDSGCRVKTDAQHYITRLVVTEIDLGAKRMVRLRKPDGREWRWYAEESRTQCSNDEHLIYATLTAAKKAASPVIQRIVNQSIETMMDQAQANLKRAEERYAETVESQKQAAAKSSEMKASLKAFGRLKVEDLD